MWLWAEGKLVNSAWLKTVALAEDIAAVKKKWRVMGLVHGGDGIDESVDFGSFESDDEAYRRLSRLAETLKAGE